MPLRNVPATSGSLLRLRKELEFIESAVSLLEEKQNVLIHEVMDLLDDAESLRERVEQTLRQAYRSLQLAHLASGIETVRRAALAAKNTVTLRIRERSIMGVPVPEVETYQSPEQLEYSFMENTPALDETSLAFRKVLVQLCELAQVYTTLSRLAEEAHRTQKRVNALEKVFVPDYRRLIQRIQTFLEERERESMFILKLGKEREQGGSAPWPKDFSG